MHRALFRGKTIEGGNWIEGHFYTQVYHKDTIEEEWYAYIKPIGSATWQHARICPETLGQYTGKNSIHGEKIFEHSIVNVIQKGLKTLRCLVFWNEEDFSFSLRSVKSGAEYGLDPNFKYELIGNKFDNPELLSMSEEESETYR